MKIIIFSIITLISITFGQSPKNYFNANKIITEEKESFTSIVNTKNASSASPNFKVRYYRCEWQVNPVVRYIQGNVTSYFKITSATDNILST